MSEPAVTSQNPVVLQGQLSPPPATATGIQAAAFALGHLLKEIVSGVPTVFHGENDVLKAYGIIDNFIKASVPGSAVRALADGDQRAAVEDVTKRVASQTGYSVPAGGAAAIDYDKLAAAIVRQQALAQLQAVEQE